MLLDYGVRSKCCYAPVRMGKRKIKKTNVSVSIWICCRCEKRDVDIVEYTKDGPPKSTNKSFADDEV